jgi:hypothetical protein
VETNDADPDMNEIKEIDLHRSGGANAPETVWSDDSALATRRDN